MCLTKLILEHQSLFWKTEWHTHIGFYFLIFFFHQKAWEVSLAGKKQNQKKLHFKKTEEHHQTPALKFLFFQ